MIYAQIIKKIKNNNTNIKSNIIVMIEIKNLKFGYSARKTLFSDLNLNLEAGHIAGLLGKNGEGKTTLLKLLGGQLLRQYGTMNVMEHDPSKREVSFLSDVYYLPEVMKVPKGCTIRRYFDALTVFYPNFSQEVADEAIDAFELNYNMRLDRLSQGQQKKAIIAFALSLQTRLLLLDEPTNGLDIPAKSVFRRLLAKYSNEDRLVIISTHQVRDLEQIIDHIIVMRNNRIIFNRSTADITDHMTFRIAHKDDTPIYAEMSPAGKFGVFAKETDSEDMFSTELFFNALMEHQAEVLSQFK